MINGRLFLIGAMAATAQLGAVQEAVRVEGKNIRIEFDRAMHSRVVAMFDAGEQMIGDFTPSEYIRVSGGNVKDFAIQDSEREPFHDSLGSGFQTEIIGTAPSLKKAVTITVYDEFPRMAFFDVEYTNTSTVNVPVNGWTNQHCTIIAGADFCTRLARLDRPQGSPARPFPNTTGRSTTGARVPT